MEGWGRVDEIKQLIQCVTGAYTTLSVPRPHLGGEGTTLLSLGNRWFRSLTRWLAASVRSLTSADWTRGRNVDNTTAEENGHVV